MNLQDIRVTTVSLTAHVGPYMVRLNGELVTPSTRGEIEHILNTIKFEAMSQYRTWGNSREIIEDVLNELFAPSARSPYRIFRRLGIVIVDNPNSVGYAGTKERKRKSKSKRRHRNV